MSSCPNCGSAKDESYNPILDVPSMDIRWHCGVYSFASGQINDPDTWEWAHGETPACELIRSLREELRVAKATLKEHELVCYGAMDRGRDAERDRIADWLDRRAFDTGTIGARLNTRGIESAIRNNEHRSDT